MKKNYKIYEKKKIILITGGMGFLGKSYTHALAKIGHLPIVLDIKKRSEIQKYVNLLNKTYKIETRGYQLDITDREEVLKISKKILIQYGKIDILINNASNNPIYEKKFKNLNTLKKFSLKQWKKDLDVGLTGAFICSKYFGEIISKNKNGGSIINISSDLGLIAPNQTLYNNSPNKIINAKPISYSVVKTGILGLSRYLSTYWLGKVRSNALCLGGVQQNQSKSFLKKINKLIPLGRMAHPNDYQGMIKFLCSDESSYLNGAVIPLDGGRTSW